MKDKNLRTKIEEDLDFTLPEREFIIKAIETYEFVQKLTMADLLKIIPNMNRRDNMNLMTEERSVECSYCANFLQCYGYMINGTINCRYCKKSFTLTQEIWAKSYLKIVMNACYPCGGQKKHGITQHDVDKKQIHLVCLSCKNTLVVNY